MDIHEEMRQRSMDLIKVYNPTDDDFVVYWDRVPHVVPAKDKDTYGHGKGFNIFNRYLADHYSKQMVDNLMLRRADKMVEEENKRRLEQGLPEMDKYQQQPAFEKKFSRSDTTERIKFYRIVNRGVVQRYGENIKQATLKVDPGPKNDQEILKLLEKDEKIDKTAEELLKELEMLNKSDQEKVLDQKKSEKKAAGKKETKQNKTKQSVVERAKKK